MKLIHGDCLEVMKTIESGSIDMILTDPPYRITPRGNGGSSGGMFQKKIVNSGHVFERNSLEIGDWLPELFRVLKNVSHCYIMTNNKNITNYLNVINESDFHFIKNLIWCKDNKIMGQSYMSQFEYIIMLRKGCHKKINNCGNSDLIHIKNKKMKSSQGKTVHDTEKPVSLCAYLINNSTKKSDIVLDPFMGIGGSGIACKNLNRDFIGIELDEGYFNIAKERIENHLTIGEIE